MSEPYLASDLIAQLAHWTYRVETLTSDVAACKRMLSSPSERNTLRLLHAEDAVSEEYEFGKWLLAEASYYVTLIGLQMDYLPIVFTKEQA